MVRILPSRDEEQRLRQLGYRNIAGIDEAGRGALMGPVVAAAVIMPETVTDTWADRVQDSKKLTPTERDILFEYIRENAITYGIGMSGHTVIDTVGIAKASRMAMIAAVADMNPVPDYLIIDYFRLPETTIPHHGITRGDLHCFTIACASILAKVTRDRLVTAMDDDFPAYGFAVHKGYGTAMHLRCLREYGPCPMHRVSFRPVREAIGNA